jgi:flagellar biosynthetic protein FlhB
MVVAKGQGYIAQRIRELAEEHGVPVITNPPLTRTIFRAVGIGQEITADLYEAVAAILAFVFRLRFPQARAVA